MRTDGVRLSWEDAWLHVRASGTEPLLRIMVEGENRQEVEAIVKTLAEKAREEGR